MQWCLPPAVEMGERLFSAHKLEGGGFLNEECKMPVFPRRVCCETWEQVDGLVDGYNVRAAKIDQEGGDMRPLSTQVS